jgi:hypothetical protein
MILARDPIAEAIAATLHAARKARAAGLLTTLNLHDLPPAAVVRHSVTETIYRDQQQDGAWYLIGRTGDAEIAVMVTLFSAPLGDADTEFMAVPTSEEKTEQLVAQLGGEVAS